MEQAEGERGDAERQRRERFLANGTEIFTNQAPLEESAKSQLLDQRDDRDGTEYPKGEPRGSSPRRLGGQAFFV